MESWPGSNRPFPAAVSRSRAVLHAATRPEGVVLSDEHDAVELLTFADARTRIRWPENAEELVALERALHPASGPPS